MTDRQRNIERVRTGRESEIQDLKDWCFGDQDQFDANNWDIEDSGAHICNVIRMGDEGQEEGESLMVFDPAYFSLARGGGRPQVKGKLQDGEFDTEGGLTLENDSIEMRIND